MNNSDLDNRSEAADGRFSHLLQESVAVTGAGQTYQVNAAFYAFVNQRVLLHTALNEELFWSGVADLLDQFVPRNRALLAERDAIQIKIDQWHQQNRYEPQAYRKFLTDIGYLQAPADQVVVSPHNVDDEIATVAGPQLVVPIKNARFAINAANARWGSLYDALYGTDMIEQSGDLAPASAYNPQRGKAVITYAKAFLDQIFPLVSGSHSQVSAYEIDDGKLKARLNDETSTSLNLQHQFVGFNGIASAPESILLVNHGLHIILLIDRNSRIGQADNAGVVDIIVEAAISTIMDCEDSVAAVDTEDKLEVYDNWLGLIRGDLSASFKKGEKTFMRMLADDKSFTHKNGAQMTLHGRSLMLIRNVGHLMTTDLIKTGLGQEVPEGIVDAIVTSLIASLDINAPAEKCNSRAGSIYIVKPKMHGPAEVTFSCDLLAGVEDLLGLSRNTLKMGIMDEERRTTVNLTNCIQAASERVIFINTGFLDRTGDEIHTSMEAGAFLPKADIKQQRWIDAYERWNVDVGLQCGLQGKAQIGKGMWAMPDLMAQMMEQKRAHPESGASTAWVPSPTAAVLHALHYHHVDVAAVQRDLLDREPALLDDILTIPLLENHASLSAEAIEHELQNNIQGILGYVVRWVDTGVGCSKVPDIHDAGLMEDRATLRISSQLLANWLRHGVCSEDQVRQTMRRMAEVVDKQNANDAGYTPLCPNPEASLSFQAAEDLILKGCDQPNGYTEPILHAYRRKAKALC